MPPGSSSSRAHGAHLELREFMAALQVLPDEQREALVLVGASGLSYEEAAAVLGTRGRHGQEPGLARAQPARGADGRQGRLRARRGGDRPFRRPTAAGAVGLSRRASGGGRPLPPRRLRRRARRRRRRGPSSAGRLLRGGVEPGKAFAVPVVGRHRGRRAELPRRGFPMLAVAAVRAALRPPRSRRRAGRWPRSRLRPGSDMAAASPSVGSTRRPPRFARSGRDVQLPGDRRRRRGRAGAKKGNAERRRCQVDGRRGTAAPASVPGQMTG